MQKNFKREFVLNYGFICNDGQASSEKPEGYTPITDDQFCRLVYEPMFGKKEQVEETTPEIEQLVAFAKYLNLDAQVFLTNNRMTDKEMRQHAARFLSPKK